MFVLALLAKATSVVVVAAAVASLVYARAWARLFQLAASGVAAGVAAIVWVTAVSEGVFWDIVQFQIQHLGYRRVGMWSIDSGFADLRRMSGIATPRQFAMSSLRGMYEFPDTYGAALLLALSVLALPIWLAWCARDRPALRAFAIAWPLSYVLLNFFGVDFASPRYFIPYLAFSAFLFAGWAWIASRYLPGIVAAVGGVMVCLLLMAQVAPTLHLHEEPWYFARARWITDNHPDVVSFTPMLFAATGAEPGCGFANPALTYGSFGETFLTAERTRRFRTSDDQLIACLRVNPNLPIVIDWAFYFFTRPHSALREYLDDEGAAHRLFFSPEAVEQWDRSGLTINPFR
jgi:hypothetical protein